MASTPLASELGKRIRQLRLLRGWSQSELAGRAKMDYKYVQKVERGVLNLTIVNIDRLRQALDVTPTELFAAPARGRSTGTGDAAAVAHLLEGMNVRSRAAIIALVRDIVRLAQTLE